MTELRDLNKLVQNLIDGNATKVSDRKELYSSLVAEVSNAAVANALDAASNDEDDSKLLTWSKLISLLFRVAAKELEGNRDGRSKGKISAVKYTEAFSAFKNVFRHSNRGRAYGPARKVIEFCKLAFSSEVTLALYGKDLQSMLVKDLLGVRDHVITLTKDMWNELLEDCFRFAKCAPKSLDRVMTFRILQLLFEGVSIQCEVGLPLVEELRSLTKDVMSNARSRSSESLVEPLAACWNAVFRSPACRMFRALMCEIGEECFLFFVGSFDLALSTPASKRVAEFAIFQFALHHPRNTVEQASGALVNDAWKRCIGEFAKQIFTYLYQLSRKSAVTIAKIGHHDSTCLSEDVVELVCRVLAAGFSYGGISLPDDALNVTALLNATRADAEVYGDAVSSSKRACVDAGWFAFIDAVENVAAKSRNQCVAPWLQILERMFMQFAKFVEKDDAVLICTRLLKILQSLKRPEMVSWTLRAISSAVCALSECIDEELPLWPIIWHSTLKFLPMKSSCQTDSSAVLCLLIDRSLIDSRFIRSMQALSSGNIPLTTGSCLVLLSLVLRGLFVERDASESLNEYEFRQSLLTRLLRTADVCEMDESGGLLCLAGTDALLAADLCFALTLLFPASDDAMSCRRCRRVLDDDGDCCPIALTNQLGKLENKLLDVDFNAVASWRLRPSTTFVEQRRPCFIAPMVRLVVESVRTAVNDLFDQADVLFKTAANLMKHWCFISSLLFAHGRLLPNDATTSLLSLKERLDRAIVDLLKSRREERAIVLGSLCEFLAAVNVASSSLLDSRWVDVIVSLVAGNEPQCVSTASQATTPERPRLIARRTSRSCVVSATADAASSALQSDDGSAEAIGSPERNSVACSGEDARRLACEVLAALVVATRPGELVQQRALSPMLAHFVELFESRFSASDLHLFLKLSEDVLTYSSGVSEACVQQILSCLRCILNECYRDQRVCLSVANILNLVCTQACFESQIISLTVARICAGFWKVAQAKRDVRFTLSVKAELVRCLILLISMNGTLERFELVSASPTDVAVVAKDEVLAQLKRYNDGALFVADHLILFVHGFEDLKAVIEKLEALLPLASDSLPATDTKPGSYDVARCQRAIYLRGVLALIRGATSRAQLGACWWSLVQSVANKALDEAICLKALTWLANDSNCSLCELASSSGIDYAIFRFIVAHKSVSEFPFRLAGFSNLKDFSKFFLSKIISFALFASCLAQGALSSPSDILASVTSFSDVPQAEILDIHLPRVVALLVSCSLSGDARFYTSDARSACRNALKLLSVKYGGSASWTSLVGPALHSFFFYLFQCLDTCAEAGQDYFALVSRDVLRDTVALTLADLQMPTVARALSLRSDGLQLVLLEFRKCLLDNSARKDLTLVSFGCFLSHLDLSSSNVDRFACKEVFSILCSLVRHELKRTDEHASRAFPSVIATRSLDTIKLALKVVNDFVAPIALKTSDAKGEKQFVEGVLPNLPAVVVLCAELVKRSMASDEISELLASLLKGDELLAWRLAQLPLLPDRPASAEFRSLQLRYLDNSAQPEMKTWRREWSWLCQCANVSTELSTESIDYFRGVLEASPVDRVFSEFSFEPIFACFLTNLEISSIMPQAMGKLLDRVCICRKLWDSLSVEHLRSSALRLVGLLVARRVVCEEDFLAASSAVQTHGDVESLVLDALAAHLFDANVAVVDAVQLALKRVLAVHAFRQCYTKNAPRWALLRPFADAAVKVDRVVQASVVANSALAISQFTIARERVQFDRWIAATFRVLLGVAIDDSMRCFHTACFAVQAEPLLGVRLIPTFIVRLFAVTGPSSAGIRATLVAAFKAFFSSILLVRKDIDGKFFVSSVQMLLLTLTEMRRAFACKKAVCDLMAELDYLDVAECAVRAKNFEDAAFYVHLSCERERLEATGMEFATFFELKWRNLLHAFSSASRDTHASKREEILLETLVGLRDTDAIHGLCEDALAQTKTRLYFAQAEKDWLKTLTLAAAAGSDVAAAVEFKSASDEALARLGLDVKNDAKREETEAYRHQRTWALGTWASLNLPKGLCAKNSFSDCLSVAFCTFERQSSASEDLSCVRDAVARARESCVEHLACVRLQPTVQDLSLAVAQLDALWVLEEICEHSHEFVQFPLELVAGKYSPGELTLSVRIVATRALLNRPLSAEEKSACLLNLIDLSVERLRLSRENRLLTEVEQITEQLESTLAAHAYDNCAFKFWRLERAKALWECREQSPAFYQLKELLKSADVTRLNDDRSKLHYASVLLTLGNARVDTNDEIASEVIGDYHSKAIELLSTIHDPKLAKRANEELAEAHLAIAKFSDKQFQAFDDCTKSKDFEMRKEFNLRALQQADVIRKSPVDVSIDAPEDTKLARSVARRLEKEARIDGGRVAQMERARYAYLQSTVKHFLSALLFDERHSIHIFRVISLWFGHIGDEALCSVIAGFLPQLPTSCWLLVFRQLVARLTTADQHCPSFRRTLKKIVVQVCSDHPYSSTFYTLYSVAANAAPYEKDSVEDRRVVAAKQIVEELKNGHTAGIFRDMERLVEAYIEFSNLRVNDAGITETMPSKLRLRKFNAKIPIPTVVHKTSASCEYDSLVHIVRFEPEFSVANGNSRPKVVQCLCSDGRTRKQLVKDGEDLRQDAVMQQVFSIVNALLAAASSTEGRRISSVAAPMRTYAVLPLSSNSAVLEFCDGTIALGDYLIGENGAHRRYFPDDLPSSECMNRMREAQERSKVDIGNGQRIARTELLLKKADRMKTFKEVCERFHPALRYFFYERFPDAAMWYRSQAMYTKSVATSSMLGYILGLGDRHLHNILIDKTTAELVHIDLGLAFDQGRWLPIPEMVPFRLSRDFVDAFGVAGVEGTFRRSCDRVLGLLRDSTQILLPIVAVLVDDPLSTWTLSSLKARRLQPLMTPTPRATAAAVRGGGHVENGRGRAAAPPPPTSAGAAVDRSSPTEANLIAERVVMRLKEKLSGREKSDWLNVSGQVAFLIDEARSTEHLSALYCGWQAYA